MAGLTLTDATVDPRHTIAMEVVVAAAQEELVGIPTEVEEEGITTTETTRQRGSSIVHVVITFAYLIDCR